jgi:hypothetical protein
MQDFLHAFWGWFAVLFALALILVYRMDFFEGVGVWDALYCALGIAVPAAAVCAFFGKNLLSGWWRIRR